MPRISNQVVTRAYQQHPFLPLLLRECRTLQSAQNEFGWLFERATCAQARNKTGNKFRNPRQVHRLLWLMCSARSRGVPLQYILGDQPFGDLNILCRKGVLIPRAETETFTVHTARLILNSMYVNSGVTPAKTRHLRIMDLCTGTGCISLLLHALLAPYLQQISVVGIDFSPVAVRLANLNLQYNCSQGLLSNSSLHQIYFRRGNVLGYGDHVVPGICDVLHTIPAFSSNGRQQCDILIANPPYISPHLFWDGTTARSVRVFEPVLALVPPAIHYTSIIGTNRQEDLFYHHILQLLFKVEAKLTVLECGSFSQAQRVVAMFKAFADVYRSSNEFLVKIWPSADDMSTVDATPCVVIVQKLPVNL